MKLKFLFADQSRHGGQGDTMGRGSATADKADRAGWDNWERTHGFTRGVESGGRRRRFGRKD